MQNRFGEESAWVYEVIRYVCGMFCDPFEYTSDFTPRGIDRNEGEIYPYILSI